MLYAFFGSNVLAMEEVVKAEVERELPGFMKGIIDLTNMLKYTPERQAALLRTSEVTYRERLQKMYENILRPLYGLSSKEKTEKLEKAARELDSELARYLLIVGAPAGNTLQIALANMMAEGRSSYREEAREIMRELAKHGADMGELRKVMEMPDMKSVMELTGKDEYEDLHDITYNVKLQTHGQKDTQRGQAAAHD